MSEEKRIVKYYEKGNTKVKWEPHKCIHSGICAQGLPDVFKPRERPWVQMDGAGEDAIHRQVLACPSQALSLG